jgi:ribulose-phosphate 3-epimerase
MPESLPVSERLRGMLPAVSVGVLAADLMNLERDVCLLKEAGIGILHFDVMDGCFCPMLTAGPQLVKAVKTSLIKDVHLMIHDPLPKLESYVNSGADMLTVHVEGCDHPHRIFQALGQMSGPGGTKPLRGVGLNPGTPLSVLEPLIDEVEMILLLAVNPGWSGQKFIGSTGRRVKQLIEMIRKSGEDVLVGVDGGISKENIADVARMGADIIVTGSAVFEGKKVLENARYMVEAVKQGRKNL